ncbi:putative Uridine diphosphate glucose pyrophosphatase [Hypsibius exemplaris]|uniref:Uridine diphosphate glucose pyrophosphatase NUDT14 n=1 Tax=Hypsibius exemplaris TaxID=2072580 RepID=A0A1W0W9W9_HYPEX|nr:putative Uridine diphosphate glucose pyrophosphatase [Hypsibius exemplaris]
MDESCTNNGERLPKSTGTHRNPAHLTEEYSANPEIRHRILDVSDISIAPCTESAYIRPCSMLYKQDGREKRWDFIKTHDSVSIIIYNSSKNALVFVKQFRPGVYVHNTDWDVGKTTIDVAQHPAVAGVTYELCAGIVDKNLPLDAIAQEEVLEETGFSVPTTQLERVTSMRSGVGIAGALQTVYFLEVTDDQREPGRGGGSAKEGELIEVVEIPLEQARTMMFNEHLARPAGFMFSLMWFFTFKYPEIIKRLNGS